ncbi:MAG: ribosome biogenesis GTPase YlqF [bacterium]
MAIQWYPGHMFKASKEIKQTLKLVDLVIEIIDARIPYSSQNPALAQLRGEKPCIRILSKSDLADPERTEEWQRYLEQEQGVKTLALTTEAPEQLKQVTQLCLKLIPRDNLAEKPVRAMIMGIPNVGKSTLINHLANRIIAKTGNEPAVTKSQQRIRLKEGVTLFDTPGVLWPKVHNDNSSYRLAATGAIKDTVVKYEEVVHYTLEYFMAAYPESIRTRYQLEQLPDCAYELMEMIGKKRGCLRAGGHVEMDKAAKIILKEYRAGQLGPITLETPEMMERETKEVIKLMEEKAAKEAARKARHKKKSS